MTTITKLVAVVLMASGVSGCHWLFPKKDPATTSSVLPINDCGISNCGLSMATANLDATECPTGQCDPDGNGLGIYVVEGGNYCFKDEGSGRLGFCPEAFVNTPNGPVLKGRSAASGNMRFEQYTLGATVDGQSAKVLSINGAGSALSITYSLQGSQRTAMGADLSRVTLQLIAGTAGTRYELSVKPEGVSPESIHGYKVQYRSVFAGKPGIWAQHCLRQDQSPDVVSFLPGRTINGMNAAVTTDGLVTTMGCGSGAIVTCLNWGYKPWEPQTAQSDERRSYVYGACLQAKRAAYFVRFNDLKSYTATGTPILKRDQYGFGHSQDPIDERNIEALWSPGGALCLTEEHRRHKQDIPIGNYHGLKPCGSPLEWTPDAKLATAQPQP
ncbi:ADYC domain-containing protein [Hyalangium gracile]|uniref:ADYC domain-containing protein n=1 Tax=Hyalangium gracile TaxID=394092 RepID=UPI001CCD9798|nr:ADYC domain-containing protein [Hyalangium gracile]